MKSYNKHCRPRREILEKLQQTGLAQTETDFVRLVGGRTNELWKFGSAGRDLVCKFFTGTHSPLFPNDPQAELATLSHLAGSDLAPRPIGLFQTSAGPFLVYEFMEGIPWQGDVRKAARLLKAIHSIKSVKDVPENQRPIDQIVQFSDLVCSGVSHDASARILSYRPDFDKVSPYQPGLLHGDPVASNMIETSERLSLIDWQCPSIGNPCADIALFLSPAMRQLYGGDRPNSESTKSFFEAYGEDQVRERYAELAPALHWRIAANCVWRAEQGDAEFAQAADAEFAFLESL